MHIFLVILCSKEQKSGSEFAGEQKLRWQSWENCGPVVENGRHVLVCNKAAEDAKRIDTEVSTTRSEVLVVSWLLKGVLAYANQQRAMWYLYYLYLSVNRTSSKNCSKSPLYRAEKFLSGFFRYFKIWVHQHNIK